MNELTAKSILIVDDDDVFRRRLAHAFRARGMIVGEASSHPAACDYILREKPDMAVLDLKLAEESGLQLLKQIREIARSIRVVVLTGYGTITTAVDSLRAGAVNYLTKPADADAVLAAFDSELVKPLNIEVPQLAQVEWDHIQRVVKDCAGNISQASKALGLHRRSLQRKLSKIPQHLK